MKAIHLICDNKVIEIYEGGGITHHEFTIRFRVSSYFVVKHLRRWRDGFTSNCKLL